MKQRLKKLGPAGTAQSRRKAECAGPTQAQENRRAFAPVSKLSASPSFQDRFVQFLCFSGVPIIVSVIQIWAQKAKNRPMVGWLANVRDLASEPLTVDKGTWELVRSTRYISIDRGTSRSMFLVAHATPAGRSLGRKG